MKVVIVNTNDYLLDVNFISEAIEEHQGGCSILIVTGDVNLEVEAYLRGLEFTKIVHLRGGKLTREESEFISSYLVLSLECSSFELVSEFDGIFEQYTNKRILSLFGGFWRFFNQAFNANNVNDGNLIQLVSSLLSIPSRFIAELREDLLIINDVVLIYQKLYFYHNEIESVQDCTSGSFCFSLIKPTILKSLVIAVRERVKKSLLKQVIDESLLKLLHVIESLCHQKGSYAENGELDSLQLIYLFYAQYFRARANVFRFSSRESETFQYIVRAFECEAIVELMYREVGNYNNISNRYIIDGKALSGAGSYIEYLGLNNSEELKLRELIKIRNLSVLGHGFVSMLPDTSEDYIKSMSSINYRYKDSQSLELARVRFCEGIQPLSMDVFRSYLLTQGVELTSLR